MLTVAITGASGFVGSALLRHLSNSGYRVIPVLRKKPIATSQAIQWNPYDIAGTNPQQWEYLDGVIHLTGESIAGGRWTPERKQRILDSRIRSTATLQKILARLQHPPKSVICASATGFYGNRGSDWVDESSERGVGFLADVCDAWEREARTIEALGIRVVQLRLGMVLSIEGGALAKMLTPFRFGLGGKFGNGQQYMSWITLEDLVAAFSFLLRTESIHGAVNAVAPQPVTNTVFTKTLASVLHRPAFATVPAVVLKTILGEMAQELLLDGVRVKPQVLLDHDFPFRDPDLRTALQHLLSR
ncbi:MAG: TIGR01777 family oxidoreductase [bacterium]|nr:TIGR01777 family oxidoreductase [bacterium]